MEQYYRTSDFYLTAYLITKGIKREKTEEEGDKCVFVFVNSIEIKSLVNDFFDGNALIDPLKYSREIKDLKTLIRSRISG